MKLRYAINLLVAGLFMLSTLSMGWAQTSTITGTVKDGESGQPLPGVNIAVIGKVIGTISDNQGNFRLNVTGPVRLRFTYVGYAAQEVDATPGQPVTVTLEVSDVQANEVVVSASRVAETILEAPVTIEKMDAVAIAQSGAANYYQGIQNMKGVDVSTSSISFQIINSRGFNSTGNTRMIQLIDGMDVQAPVLNFPVGNLNGPSELDVQSVEFVPGASSALYGPQAFSGALVITSKDPFTHQGLSAFAKYGAYQPRESGPTMPLFDASIRWAKAFNDKIAFKLNVSYFSAEDWHGALFDETRTDPSADLYRGSAPGLPNLNPLGFSRNPAYNGVHTLGDEPNFNLNAVLNTSTFFTSAIGNGIPGDPNQFGALGAGFTGLAGALMTTPANLLRGIVPNQFVTRTGYWEGYLLDYSSQNFKFNPAIHWRAADNLEVIAQYNGGWGTSIYTGAQRYSLRDFSIQQWKLEARGDNYFVRGYYTLENSGNSYIADAVGFGIADANLNTSTWLGTYNIAYTGFLTQAATGAIPGITVPGGAAALLNANNIPLPIRDAAHNFARTTADAGRWAPGSPEFNNALDAIRNRNLAASTASARGAAFDDASALLHFDGQYDFKNQIDFMDLQIGGSYREYLLNTNGTILDDLNEDIQFNEWGIYVQAGKRFFDDKLRVSGSVRYDKNQNFDGQFNPRLAAQWEITKNHFIRASYQTGFRFATTQGQYINLDVGTSRLLGGLPQLIDKYQLRTNTYTEASVEQAQAAYPAALQTRLTQLGNPAPGTPTFGVAEAYALLDVRPLLVEFMPEPLKPEQVQAYEIGYKGLIGDKLFIDFAYYYNDYSDFITQVFVRRTPVDAFSDASQVDPDGPGPLPAFSQAAALGMGTLLRSPRLSNSTNTAPHADASGSNPGTASVFFPYTNSSDRVQAHGAVLGVEYSLPGNFYVNANYNWNKLITEIRPEVALIYAFNTPEHKSNVTFGSKKIFKNGSFSATWRWQDAFLWESSFAIGTVPAVNVVDAQVSYRLPNAKTTVKLGGSNLLNNRYFLNYGGPSIGAIYYVQLTFDTAMTN